jgi:ribose 5-phosphate isomerase A
LSWVELAKRSAAIKAVELIREGYVIGIGSGSTVSYAIAELARRVKEEGLKVVLVPTSYQAEYLAIQNNLPLTSLNEHPNLDLSIDSSDQVDMNLNLIKGGGAALTREKIVDSSAKKLVIIVDERKLTSRLGRNQHVPIEVLPFGLKTTIKKIENIGGKPVLREAEGKVGPVITDNGNFIVDVDFGEIEDPLELNTRLKIIPGVIETGLFLNMADVVYIGKRDGTVSVIEKGGKR